MVGHQSYPDKERNRPFLIEGPGGNIRLIDTESVDREGTERIGRKGEGKEHELL